MWNNPKYTGLVCEKQKVVFLSSFFFQKKEQNCPVYFHCLNWLTCNTNIISECLNTECLKFLFIFNSLNYYKYDTFFFNCYIWFISQQIPILTTDSQQMSRRRITQCLNGCWQISFSHPHPLQYGNSRNMSACVSVFRLPAWAGYGQRVAIPAVWKVLLAPQHCLRGGFTGNQWSSESRAKMGRDECALGGCDQQCVLAKSWVINFAFCWAVAGRESPAQVLMGTLTTSVLFFWWERRQVMFNIAVPCGRTDPT